MNVWLVLLAIAVLVPVFRKVLANKVWAPRSQEDFSGTMLRIGEHLVCLPDRSHLPAEVVSRTTLICFPGFLEDVRYFLEVHRDTPARLILIGNANYQNPFRGVSISTPPWFTGNPHPMGTIAHDAYCVNQVLEHMTGPERVVLHGHSRGGAVILEAGNQLPEQARSVEALLEAAVVPRGRLFNNGEKKLQPVGFYLFPFLLTLARILPASRLLKSPMMWVTNDTKNSIVSGIPFTPRQYATAEINSANIIEWQARTDYQSYEHFQRVTLFVGERDGVLCRKAMLDSAAHSPSITVIETKGTDHFISLESPDTIRAYFADNTFSSTSK
jgi:pimeloyl-ACP methyl ester carboxylesterase